MPHSIVNIGRTLPQPSPKGREKFHFVGTWRAASLLDVYNSLIIKHLPPPPKKNI